MYIAEEVNIQSREEWRTQKSSHINKNWCYLVYLKIIKKFFSDWSGLLQKKRPGWWQTNTFLSLAWVAFKKMGFTHCKNEELLQIMELQEKEAQKD